MKKTYTIYHTVTMTIINRQKSSLLFTVEYLVQGTSVENLFLKNLFTHHSTDPHFLQNKMKNKTFFSLNFLIQF